ncbi:MAG TPA: hypothetical protein VMS75_05110 [Terriglobales bacterium]|nr:hypothetical protein [Terriglobales bacterium]
MAKRPRRLIPPPERLTLKDIAHIFLGFLMVPLGAVILYHALATVKSITGLAVGAAFVAFGVYRLTTAFTRYRMLLRNKARM